MSVPLLTISFISLIKAQNRPARSLANAEEDGTGGRSFLGVNCLATGFFSREVPASGPRLPVTPQPDVFPEAKGLAWHKTQGGALSTVHMQTVTWLLHGQVQVYIPVHRWPQPHPCPSGAGLGEVSLFPGMLG